MTDYSALPQHTSINVATATAKVSAGAIVHNIERLDASLGAGDDSVKTRAGAYNDNVRMGEGEDTTALGRGADRADGCGGEDLLVMNWSAATANIRNFYDVAGWAHNEAHADRINYVGYERFALTGGAGDDHLAGGALADTLSGGGGNDTLDSGVGSAAVIRAALFRAAVFCAGSSYCGCREIACGADSGPDH